MNNVDPTGMDWYSYVSSNGKKFQWFEYEKRTSFEVAAQSGKVTYTNAGAEIYFKATDNYIYHGTSTGQVERLLPLPTVDVYATPIHPSLTYGTGSANTISGIAEDRSAGGNTKNALDIGGGAFAVLEKMAVPGHDNYFLGQNGKYYNKQPNGITGSRIGALKASKMYKIAGGVATAAAAGAEIWLGIEKDDNAQKATASAGVGALGGWAGAALGAKGGAIVGTAICPGIGTAIGAAVGAAGLGFLGSEAGSWIGKTGYDQFNN